MISSSNPVLIAVRVCWAFFGVLTAVGSVRRGDGWVRAVLSGVGFIATWVVWFVEDNHRAGRKAFRSR